MNVLPFSLFWLAPDAILANPHVRLVGRRNGVQMVSRVSFLDSDHWRAISRYLRGHMNRIGAIWGELLYRMCFAMEKVRSKNLRSEFIQEIHSRERPTARHPGESFLFPWSA